MSARLLLLEGDGVGPEVIAEARRVLEWIIANRGFDCEVIALPYGLEAYKRTGRLMSKEVLETAMEVDAVLFGAIGGPEYDRIVPLEENRRGSILRLRTEMRTFANLRPAIGLPEIADAVPLKPEVIDGVDLLLVREGNGGIYFGQPRGLEVVGNEERGLNTEIYTTSEVQRVARTAFKLARERTGRVCSVDKSNVLESGQVWRNAVTALHRDEFPDIELTHMYVDNCAMQLVRWPKQFDVLVTSNMFGDILSDGAAAIMGSLGMAASGSLNDPEADGRRRGLYEPVHGSAPDIAGKGIANPLGAIQSLAMALRYSFDRPDDAELIMTAMRRALARGVRTPDIAGRHQPVGSSAMTDALLAELERLQ